MEAQTAPTKPDGPVAAVLLATGIGAAVLAVLTVVAEAEVTFKDSLAYDLEVGPLSGKTLWAAGAFFASWGLLTAVLRKRDVDMNKVLIVAGVLLAIGLVGTFAPFFELFTAEE